MFLARLRNPYTLQYHQYVLGQITPVLLKHKLTSRAGNFERGKNNKLAAEVFLSCFVTIGVNSGLANDWRNIAKKMLQKDQG